MTQELTIKQGNELIAEFMDERFDDGTFSYHRRWDYLMPVARKVLDTDAGLSVYQLYVCDSLRTANIETVWKSVIHFIENHKKI